MEDEEGVEEEDPHVLAAHSLQLLYVDQSCFASS